MSRIGKKPIAIPQKTEVSVSDNVVSVKGPLGELSIPFRPVIDIRTEEGNVILTPKDNKLETKALWGTYASHIENMIEGVNKGYEKKLKIEGVGYKADVKGDNLSLSIGFSHPVLVPIYKGVKCVVEKDTITISGISKDDVGQFAAKVRDQKRPEPYKGKGIRYENEVILRKEGKKAL